MKPTWFSVLAGLLAVLVMAITLIIGINLYRANIEQQAYELMTATAQAIMEGGDWNPVLENMVPEAGIQTSDMSALRNFGRLVALGDMEGFAEVSLPMSGQPTTAQLRMAGHFSNGICYTEAIMVYQDSRWQFSHFAFIPGEFAQ